MTLMGMGCKEKIEEILDRRFGKASPNLPTRVLYCNYCDRMISIKTLEKGVCMGHRMVPVENTLWNCLKTIIQI
jgi:hypothetical protein